MQAVGHWRTAFASKVESRSQIGIIIEFRANNICWMPERDGECVVFERDENFICCKRGSQKAEIIGPGELTNPER